MAEITEPDDQINLEGLQSSICVRLAALSEIADTPTEFANSSTQVTSDSLGFGDGTWIPALVNVQGWLRLDKDLEIVPAEVFIPRLVEALGGDVDDDMTTADDAVTLTESGLAQLDDRLDLAMQHQGTFIEAYNEETGTRASATAAWADAWGEDEDDEEDSVGVVQATTEAWHILTFLNSDLNLTPSYQRGDVWSASMRQRLIESILRGIPLPSIILLRPDDPTIPYEVVDGKQRLTAILRFVGRHPRAIAYAEALTEKHPDGVDMVRLLSHDYPKFRREWKTIHHVSINTTVEQEYFLPFKLRNRPKSLKGFPSPIDGVWGKYYSQILNVKVGVEKSEVLVKQIFETAPKYKIPVIEYTSTHPRQIHEVFNLYNRQGVHLNAEEIRNAIYHELEITRALLVAGGDADIENANVPALRRIEPQMRALARNVTEYRFSPTRYRRTKIMSWVVATLLHETAEGGSLPSTAKHIDTFLDRITDAPADPMRGAGTLEDLFKWIAASVEWHAGAGDETWSPSFQSSLSRGGWQELQLVGSITGVAIVFAAHPDTAEDMLEGASEDLYEGSQTSRAGWDKSAWARPPKTQTREQWQCIANIASAVVEVTGADKHAAHQALVRNYGSSGVAALLAQAKTYA